jgi:hypothetical protein
MIARDADGNTGVANVYNNANKIFNLRKGLPIGAITWGAGSIGVASISTLAKDLRRRLTGEEPKHVDDWKIDPAEYSVEQVANLVYRFMYEEHYVPAFTDWPEKPVLGFIVAGYSHGEDMAEEYQILTDTDGDCSGPQLLRPKNDTGMVWNGQPEAITRLVFGFSSFLPQVLEQNLGVPPEQIAPALEVLKNALTAPLAVAPMPFQDAIDLAEFLVDLTIKFTRFFPGPKTVGGPIEIAAISKHEGFKWVQRKQYYRRILNPEVS